MRLRLRLPLLRGARLLRRRRAKRVSGKRIHSAPAAYFKAEGRCGSARGLLLLLLGGPGCPGSPPRL